MTDIQKIKGKYRVVYSSSCDIHNEKARKELDAEKINIDWSSDLEFSIRSEDGPTGKWQGSFRLEKDCPQFASGEYEYICDSNNKPQYRKGRKGKHKFIFDPYDTYVLVHGRDISSAGKPKDRPFSLLLQKEQ
jgi:hypothetical protein